MSSYDRVVVTEPVARRQVGIQVLRATSDGLDDGAPRLSAGGRLGAASSLPAGRANPNLRLSTGEPADLAVRIRATPSIAALHGN